MFEELVSYHHLLLTESQKLTSSELQPEFVSLWLQPLTVLVNIHSLCVSNWHTLTDCKVSNFVFVFDNKVTHCQNWPLIFNLCTVYLIPWSFFPTHRFEIAFPTQRINYYRELYIVKCRYTEKIYENMWQATSIVYK